jgi:hypothetical protein
MPASNKLTSKLIFYGVIALIIGSIIFFTLYFLYRTTYYINYLKNCPKNPETFCYIKKFKLELPKEFIAPLLTISKEEGKRVEIIKKRQKAISIRKLTERFPEVVEWYKNLPTEISKVIGTQVQITPLNQPNSLSLVVYEKEGDYIDWHFDTNHYNGRYFTLLVPVSTEKTCGNYQYKDESETVQTVELQLGEAILFEGDRVFHRGKELCVNQRRVILSCTFTTSQDIPPQEIVINAVKNWGIFGEL